LQKYFSIFWENVKIFLQTVGTEYHSALELG
jgi:hypothetical protein